MNEPSVVIRSVARVENEPYLSLTVEISCDGRREKRVLVIPDKVYLELKLKKGGIDTDTFDRLEAESRVCAAYRRGLSILGYGANSERALSRKLTQKGFDKESAKAAAAALKSEGCISEERDAEREVEACLRKCWGERRIIAKLYEKGYSDDAIVSARAVLDDVDFPELCAELIEKRYSPFPAEQKARENAIAALMRYGDSLSEIRQALTLIK